MFNNNKILNNLHDFSKKTMNNHAEFLKDLQNFIEMAELRVNKLLNNFSWNKCKTLKDTPNKICNTTKKTDFKKIQRSSCNSDSRSILLDVNTIMSILPSITPERLSNLKGLSEINIILNSAEKLALRNYVIAKTGKFTEPENSFMVESNDNQRKPRTLAEILALKRDNKRRKLKYRRIGGPFWSYKEQTRKLIELQMETFSENLKNFEKNKCERDKLRKKKITL